MWIKESDFLCIFFLFEVYNISGNCGLTYFVNLGKVYHSIKMTNVLSSAGAQSHVCRPSSLCPTGTPVFPWSTPSILVHVFSFHSFSPNILLLLFGNL